MADEDENNIDELIKEYEENKALYHGFKDSIKSLLEILLKNNNFFYQTVTGRVKDLQSIEGKIKGRKLPKSLLPLKSITDLQDVIGCRVFLYLDSDLEKFASLLYQEFGKENILKYELKYSEDNYNGVHLVVRLDSNRLKLPEYSKFKGLKCEIQLTTPLYHAWSEMAHDTIYKPQEDILDFDKPAFESLKAEFASIMKNHIKKASISFQFIHSRVQELKQGKKVFDLEFLKSINQSPSNNDLFENLSLLSNYVERFGDKTPPDLNIISIVQSVLERSKKIKPIILHTAIGDLPGKTYTDVALICLKILKTLGHFYPKEVFEILTELGSSKEIGVRGKALEVIKNIYSFNLQVLQVVGLQPQFFVVEEIEKWDNKKLRHNLEVVLTIAKELLEPSFEGHSMSDHKTFTWSFGSLDQLKGIKQEDLRTIRNKVIAILQKLFVHTGDINEKIKIIKVLKQSTYPPVQGNYGEIIQQIILENSVNLVDFYFKVIKDCPNEVIKSIESQINSIAERFSEAKIPQLKELTKVITSNQEYQIFRVLVGYEHELALNEDLRKLESQRLETIQKFIDNLNQNNIDLWVDRLIKFLREFSYDKLGEYEKLFEFINKLSNQKPDLGYYLLTKNEKDLEPLLLHILRGLWESSKKNLAEKVMLEWVSRGKYLSICATVFASTNSYNYKTLRNIFVEATKAKDINALRNVVKAIIVNSQNSKDDLELFKACISEFTKNKSADWVRYIWFCKLTTLGLLDEKGYNLILENLLILPSIDHEAEDVLKPILTKYPKKVIDFFRKRAEKKREKNFLTSRYEAVPFRFYELDQSLKEQAQIIVPEILKWFDSPNGVVKLRASTMLHTIFPSFDPNLEKALLDLIKSKNIANIEKVLLVLHSYQGESFLHGVYKELIKTYYRDPKFKKYKQEILIALSRTGVVTGEYGFANAYQQKKEAVKNWSTEKDNSVKEFLKDYEKFLNDNIAFEKKQAETMEGLMKKEFGEE